MKKIVALVLSGVNFVTIYSAHAQTTNTTPNVSCPSPVVAECSEGTLLTLSADVSDSDGGALTVEWLVNGALVETDGVSAGSIPTSDTVSLTYDFPFGTNDVSVYVEDDQGASFECSTTVTIQDTLPPEVVTDVDRAVLWPPNHRMVNVGLDVSVGSCNPDTLTEYTVYSNEDDEAPTGSGFNFSPDAKDDGSQLKLRAERSAGNKDGRIYLIVATSTNAGGATVTCTSVVVPHNKGKKALERANAAAQAAEEYCIANGVPPAEFVVVGEGPTKGPKH